MARVPRSLTARAVAVAVPFTATLLWLVGASGVAAAETLPAPTPLDFLRDWSFDPSIQIPILLSAAIYLYLVRRVNLAHPDNPVPRSRVIAFLGGLAVLEFALQGVLDAYDDILFADHMVQHVCMMMVAAPLLVMGAPITLVLRAATPRVRMRYLLPLLHSRIVETLSNPIAGGLLFSAVLWGTHFSGIYELTLVNQTVHNIEHAAYLAAALLFWWPMVGTDPNRWRLSYPVRLIGMTLEMISSVFLGVAIAQASYPLYSHYVALHLSWMSPMADQSAAGTIMWIGVGLTMLPFHGLLMRDWIRADRREAARIDRQLDRQRGLEGA